LFEFSPTELLEARNWIFILKKNFEKFLWNLKNSLMLSPGFLVGLLLFLMSTVRKKLRNQVKGLKEQRKALLKQGR
jgi:hypothetical protein